MDRIELLRKKEKEARQLWNDLYSIKDLRYLVEDRFDYKEYKKELIEGILFVLIFGVTFFVLWFILP